MTDKIRMGFVGLGRWSGMLAEAATKSGRVEIAACYSRTEAKMVAFTKKYGGSEKTSYQDLIKDKNFDAVVLTTPDSAHAEQAIEAARNSKHIFVEKPLATLVGDAKRMIAEAKEANVILAVGHKHRRLARYRKAKELLAQGALGEILLVEASSSSDLGLKLTPEIWRWYRKENPIGPLMPHTVHLTDLLNHLIGPMKTVTAFSSKLSGKAETDDVFSSVVRFECGALGYIGGAFLTPSREVLQIHGVEGVIWVDEEDGGTYFQKKGTDHLVKQGVFPDSETQKRDALAEEIDEFARCIQNGGKPETAGEEGLAALAVIEAITRSATSGLAVEIKDLY